ncbi:MAG: DNA repair protein RecO [Rhodobacteraceae bacterium]|jgi:DNA repair protein RecO (recombination protein O)|nr:DNA repair protein RecO [Paracoccaceae bacterium]
MEWRAEGLVLAVRPHGEHAAIVELLTAAHGRHAGVVRGGQSRRMTAVLQPGTRVDAVWRARLGEHLGALTLEPLQSRAGLLADRRALAGLNAVCGLLLLALPERAPHPGLHAATNLLLDAMLALPDWPQLYLRWEIGLLEALGFALDLSCCAVTGQTSDLAFVSPKTGRAVSRAAAGPWADRLLILPPGMAEAGAPVGDLAAGLAITGHFLQRGLAPVLAGRLLPDSRARLVDLLIAPTG